VHVLHVHESSAPTPTLSRAGVNLLFVTVSDVVDDVTGGPGSVTPFAVDDPPPHATSAAHRNNETVVMRLLTTELLMRSSE
jgi:hypothetical protein